MRILSLLAASVLSTPVAAHSSHMDHVHPQVEVFPASAVLGALIFLLAGLVFAMRARYARSPAISETMP